MDELPDVNITVSEFIALNDRLTEFIFQWLSRELKQGIDTNPRLKELFIFNMKLIYTDCDVTNTFLNFFLEKDVADEVDNTFSRIQDLFINITIAFPSYFIESIRIKHINALKLLGYNTNEKMMNKLHYGWLFAKIQDVIRFRIMTKSP